MVEDEEYFSDAVQEEMRLFADKITPPNWNFWIHPKDIKYIPGTLNIHLWFLDKGFDEKGENPLAAVRGPMRVNLISSFKNDTPEVNEALKKYGDGRIAFADIEFYLDSYIDDEGWIDPDWRIDVEATMVHELAHVAVTRYFLKKDKEKPRRNNFLFFRTREDDQHGPIFQRFFDIMINRATKVLGEKWAEDACLDR